MTIDDINHLPRAEFEARIGPIFEHSPWIASAAWERRPFGSREDLLAALFEAVEAAGADRLMDLIQAHPDLVGRLARQGALTKESTKEQASAGLLTLDAATVARFEEKNTAYRERFGFPFIICARLNSVDTILQAFEARLANTRDDEMRAAWNEIRKIAALRLEDLMATS